MKKKVFIRWIKALRSGLYPKTSGALKNDVGFCALGVLCEISKIAEWEPEPNTKKFQYLGQIHYLPKQVAEWAGMTFSEASKVNAYLITYNDKQRKDFNDLADLLEKKYMKKEKCNEPVRPILPE